MAVDVRRVSDLTSTEFLRLFNAALAEQRTAAHEAEAWRDTLGEREAMRMLDLGSQEAVQAAQQQLDDAEARLARTTAGIRHLKSMPQAIGSR